MFMYIKVLIASLSFPDLSIFNQEKSNAIKEISRLQPYEQNIIKTLEMSINDLYIYIGIYSYLSWLKVAYVFIIYTKSKGNTFIKILF